MIFIHTIVLLTVLQTPAPAEVEFQTAATAGQQTVQLQHSLPLVNQVVLVPDEATYLDELSKWSPEARWPILFDDNRLAPMFIRKFRPQKVWRRTSVGKPVENFKTISQQVIAKAWGGTASPEVALANNAQVPDNLRCTLAEPEILVFILVAPMSTIDAASTRSRDASPIASMQAV